MKRVKSLKSVPFVKMTNSVDLGNMHVFSSDRWLWNDDRDLIAFFSFIKLWYENENNTFFKDTHRENTP